MGDLFLKEVREQPAAVAETVRSQAQAVATLVERVPGDLQRVVLVGCGDPYFAAQAAIYPLERWSRLPAEAIDGLEFRFWRHELVDERTLVVLISQSGKTIQVIEAGRLARDRGATTAGITNTPESPLAEQCDHLLVTAGGPSYSFPTRTTTAAMALLFTLALELGRRRGTLASADAAAYRALLSEQLPAQMAAALELESGLLALARSWQPYRHFAFAGTGPGYAAALIGAAKINETSRLQAEADQLEEYGHLHLFAIQPGTPLVFLAPSQRSAARVKAMVEFATGRGHPVAIFAPQGSRSLWQPLGVHLFELPAIDELLSPLLYAVSLQLLAYNLAVTLGRDPDRPEGFDNVAIQKMIYTGLLEGWHEPS